MEFETERAPGAVAGAPREERSGRHFQGPKKTEVPPSGEKGTLLHRLREKQGLSQRRLAQKSGISRGRLRRLEGKHFDDTTYGELQRVSQALGMELRQLLLEEEKLAPRFYLGRAGEGVFHLDAAPRGYRIVSFFPSRPDLFAGKLFVLAKNEISSAHVPRASLIFLQMLLGTLQIELGGETHEIREGDHLLFQGDTLYSLQNPLPRDSVAFLVTLPAFTLP